MVYTPSGAARIIATLRERGWAHYDAPYEDRGFCHRIIGHGPARGLEPEHTYLLYPLGIRPASTNEVMKLMEDMRRRLGELAPAIQLNGHNISIRKIVPLYWTIMIPSRQDLQDTEWFSYNGFLDRLESLTDLRLQTA